MRTLDQQAAHGRPDPRIWHEVGMLMAVMARDFTSVYRLLHGMGYSQQRIAVLTGQSQPEVSAVIDGRKIIAYDVITRVVDGLGIPRGMAGVCTCWCMSFGRALTLDAVADADPTLSELPPGAGGPPNSSRPRDPG